MTPPIRSVHLHPNEATYAATIAYRRNADRSRPMDGGGDQISDNVYGAMAEVAVCLYYGEDYRRWVTVVADQSYAGRGATPDLMHDNYRVSVKSTTHWGDHIHLIVPEHDTMNDIYVMVSVDVDRAVCGIRGWVTRDTLLTYQPEPTRFFRGRPAQGSSRLWRYIPVRDLRPCRVREPLQRQDPMRNGLVA
jgi:hypothetical protein